MPVTKLPNGPAIITPAKTLNTLDGQISGATRDRDFSVTGYQDPSIQLQVNLLPAEPGYTGVLTAPVGTSATVAYTLPATSGTLALVGSSPTTDSFTTIQVPAGTSPVATSSTDTLTLAETAGIDIVGNSATDTVTFSLDPTELPATGAQAGFLTSADWTTFNGKQASGSYITSLTGDVTASGPGAAAAAIGVNKVANSQLAQMPANTIKGNNTGSTANALDLTSTQVTAALNAFVGDSGAGGTKGLVPAPASGDAAASKFLKADGTWAASGALTVGTIDSQTKAANGAVITGSSLVMQTADATNPGLVSTGTQTIAGAKTFSGAISASNLSGTNTGNQTITLTGDVTGSGTGSFAATIANDAVTYAKMQNASAYTLPANNTSGSADLAETTFRSDGSATYSSTITWTGTTAPSGATTHTYRWTRIGNLVTVTINLSYATPGTGNAVVTMDLPSALPAPSAPSGFSGANALLYFGSGNIGIDVIGTGLGTAITTVGYAANGSTAIMQIGRNSISALKVWGTVQYFTS